MYESKRINETQDERKLILPAKMSETTVKETEGDGETDQSTTSFMRNTMVSNTMVSSTMVSGEASETDDEEDDEVDDKQRNEKEDEELEEDSKHLKEEQDLNTEIHEFELETGAEVKGKRQKIVYKFDSPFHRKLRERNLELRSHLVEGLTQFYVSAGSKLESSTFHLSRAQTVAQDVSHNTGMMLEDLTHLSTLLESVLGSGELIPLKINVNNPPDTA